MKKVVGREQLSFPLSDLDLEKIFCLNSEDSIESIVSLMAEKRIGSVGLTKDEKIVGIITEKDFISRFPILKRYLIDNDNFVVNEMMTKNPMIFKSEQLFVDALETMVARDFRHLPFKKDNDYYILSVRDILNTICKEFENELSQYSGIKNWSKKSPSLQEGDILSDDDSSEGISAGVFQKPLKQIYSSNIIHVDINSSIAHLLEKMNQKHIGVAFVMRYETEFCGIITERDILTKFVAKKMDSNNTVEELMTPNPDYLSIHHQFGNAIKNMQLYNYRNMPVVNQEGYPIGNVSLLELMSFFASFLR